MTKINNEILSSWKRKVIRMHNSYCVSLPISWVRANRLNDKDSSVSIELKADGKVEIHT